MTALVRQCAAHGPVRSVGLFCRADRPEQLLCMVQMDANAAAAAAALERSFLTGHDLCTFVKVGPEFGCEQRAAGRMMVPNCSACRRQA